MQKHLGRERQLGVAGLARHHLGRGQSIGHGEGPPRRTACRPGVPDTRRQAWPRPEQPSVPAPPIQSLERGMRLLEVIARSHQPLDRRRGRGSSRDQSQHRLAAAGDARAARHGRAGRDRPLSGRHRPVQAGRGHALGRRRSPGAADPREAVCHRRRNHSRRRGGRRRVRGDRSGRWLVHAVGALDRGPAAAQLHIGGEADAAASLDEDELDRTSVTRSNREPRGR